VSQNPVAFLSYVRFVDQYENGRITEFCKRLSGEVQLQTGEEFSIFQDRNDIAWGQQWQERINESLDAVTFLIPILTPSFFKRDACRSELERFLDREKQLKRNDLILPVYYIDCPVLNEASKRDADPLAKVIASRQPSTGGNFALSLSLPPKCGK
jgi:TIR domain